MSRVRLPAWVARRRRARARTPTILQMEAVECGAAALAIVLAHHGRYVPLEELRIVCGISRDGSKASNMVRAARGFGMQAQGLRLETEALRGQDFPLVLFWNFNHFLVLEGFAKEGVYLNDPACGPRRVTHAEFDQAYTGVALQFTPGEAFVRGGRAPGVIAGLRPRMRGFGRPFLFVLLASLALVIPGLAIPIFTQVFIDNVLGAGLDDWIRPLLLGMAFTALLRSLLTWLQQSQLLRLETQLALASSGGFFWYVLRLPIEFFNQRYAGDISQRVGANDHVAKLLSGSLATNAVNVVALAFYLLVMLQYDWRLTLVCLLFSALNLVALQRAARATRDANLRQQQDIGKLMATTMGGIQTIESIKAGGSEQDFFMRWAGYNARVSSSSQASQVQGRLVALAPGLLAGLATMAILGVGGARVMAGEMSIGMLVAFQSLAGSFNQPIASLMGLASSLQAAAGELARLDDVLHYPLDARFVAAPAAAAAPLRQLEGYLELRHIEFGYSRLEPPLIRDFSLSIAPGQRVALVGGSGSGKSTIARLVMGLHTPWSGEILFDGVTRSQWPAEVLNATLAGVDQEICLFEGTLRENLSLWDKSLPQPDLQQAAQDAEIDSVITARNGAYDSAVEEGGRNFSGGQAQRLEIARALAGNPRILVLDEATAALDALTEKQIDDHLRQRGCAALVVAHRLSTIRDCDEIIVMEAGRIVERGSHAALMQQGGAYCRLVATE